MKCYMSEPCKFPSLDSCQKRFLWTHKDRSTPRQALCTDPIEARLGIKFHMDVWFTVMIHNKTFKFRWHSARKPTSIVYDNEQGDLFYFAGPHRNQRQQHPKQRKTRERTWKMKLSGPENRSEIKRKKSPAAEKRAGLYSDLLQGFTLTYSRPIF